MSGPRKFVHSHKGVDHWSCKLTEEDVRLIRALYLERKKRLAYADELTMGKIAVKFGVAEGTVRDVILYETWKHVE